ncbi:MAG: DNA repair protein RecO [Chlorobiaceae bacterium]
MIVKTQAVILREIKYLDQSKICAIYTRDFGKISVIINGARSQKNKLSGLFNTGNVIDLILYKKNNSNIQFVSDGNLILSPMVPSPDIERLAILYRIIDTVRCSTENEEKNLRLFTLLVSTLQQLYRNAINSQQLYAWFLLRLVSIMGFQLSLRNCVLSGKELLPAVKAMNLSELYFIMKLGGFALPVMISGDPSKKQLIPVSLALQMSIFASTQYPNGNFFDSNSEDIDILCNLLQEYCSFHLHLDHTRSRKNLAIISQILLK